MIAQRQWDEEQHYKFYNETIIAVADSRQQADTMATGLVNVFAAKASFTAISQSDTAFTYRVTIKGKVKKQDVQNMKMFCEGIKYVLR